MLPPRDGQSRQQVLVQFEPDAVEGVPARSVDPGAFSLVDHVESVRQPLGIPPEPFQLGFQFRAQRTDTSQQRSQVVEYAFVPAPVAVVVGRKWVTRQRSDLPVRCGGQEASIQLNEPVVHGRYLGSKSGPG